MATAKGARDGPGAPEWRVTVPEGAPVTVEHEAGRGARAWAAWLALRALAFRDMVLGFGGRVWRIGADDPRRAVHGLKVGLALALVSAFYYTRPLYDGVGGAAMWAVLTVVVVFEYTVGGCVYKGLNRAIATASAAVVALGVHWIASKSGDKFEPFIRSGSACVEEYFAAASAEVSGSSKQPSSKAEGYRCVLNSKASEDSQANLARWEPPHGRFGYRHPYAQYRNVGAAMRHCAYCVEALIGCVRSAETQAAAPGHARRRLADACTRVAAQCATVLREASGSVSAMTTSIILNLAVADMNAAVQELQADMRALPSTLLLAEAGSVDPAASTAPLLIMDTAQLFTVTSLLIEMSARIEGVVDAVDTLASLANFKSADDEKPVESATKVQPVISPDPEESGGNRTMKALEQA
ncbi:hypothetical protein C2845_PM15G18810 [Panicum miliaceum]|uniref:Aluminum-activated malate transporter 10-like n=1 Tax=Panicum miliaceum TaxID=4540 RepID=A0A3L6Q7E3_PANMI|nr:hypothetical protein C2845_PM15G18810 [Panicum miliaceum]